MEKVLEKLKTDDEILQDIVDELIKQCEKEPAFADKILSEKKSLKECWEYIKSQARKKAVSNCAKIDDTTVYGWAIHYFDEETLEDWKPVRASVSATSNKLKAKSKAKVKNDDDIDNKDNFDDEDNTVDIDDDEEVKPVVIKPKAKKTKGVAEGQLSLFDL